MRSRRNSPIAPQNAACDEWPSAGSIPPTLPGDDFPAAGLFAEPASPRSHGQNYEHDISLLLVGQLRPSQPSGKMGPRTWGTPGKYNWIRGRAPRLFSEVRSSPGNSTGLNAAREPLRAIVPPCGPHGARFAVFPDKATARQIAGPFDPNSTVNRPAFPTRPVYQPQPANGPYQQTNAILTGETAGPTLSSRVIYNPPFEPVLRVARRTYSAPSP